MTKPESVRIDVQGREPVSGLLDLPRPSQQDAGTGVIIAHGAGNDMTNPLLVYVAAGLARAGIPALRFNFPYKEKGKKAPDRPDVLMATWSAAFNFFQKESGWDLSRVIAAGKSMGGRIASMMAASGDLPVDGLVYLGYPLHPPGKKDKLRDSHLYGITVPQLYFAGTRDPLCDLNLLRRVLHKLTSPWDLEVIEGGDHSFKVLKSMGIAQEMIHRRILDAMTVWLGKGDDSG